MLTIDHLKGCILGGAIGDAMGSYYENKTPEEDTTYHLFRKPKTIKPTWQITDDTQLTLLTIQAIIEDISLSPEILVKHFIKAYQKRNLRGLGSSTLKALQELEVGGHWTQSGRRGEFAAGNGAAMRIAPIAFLPNVTRKHIQDICSITHKNDEAYIGALSVVIALQEIAQQNWNAKNNLLTFISEQIPDSRVRDRMIQLSQLETLSEIGSIGNTGYVVDTVPLAIAAANKINELGIETMFDELIKIGGDTDTICAIAGQISGCYLGGSRLPDKFTQELRKLAESEEINTLIEQFGKKLKLH